ncbi:hypothetical protein A9Q99_10625 [Gammaproteobacteria bacterium 45_16_T64]|nr:hypothetical protein A9Q99_10625 [Gammaproteobacteria bacterium 45_16_T64]
MKKHITMMLGVLGMLAASAGYSDPNARVEYGTVIESHPIMQVVRHREPRQECWDETVVHRERGRQSATGTILGGIIGAAIGNKVGHGRDNKRIGAVAGAVLGASIGNDVSRNGRHGHRYQAVEQRCQTTYEEIEEERVVGYRVKYRYAGQTYSTETDRDPGNSIRLRVSVVPAE